jgi:hypothetical protein
MFVGNEEYFAPQKKGKVLWLCLDGGDMVRKMRCGKISCYPHLCLGVLEKWGILTRY